MSLIIGMGGAGAIFPFDHYYGVEWDTTIADPSLTRVGKLDLHAQLPIQSKMKRCILNDAGEVVYYLSPTDSTKTEGGAAADLSGATGQVMVEVPRHYRCYQEDGTKRRMLISEYDLPGFIEVPKFYIGAYEAALDRVNNKLSSVVNTSPNYRGGDNNAAWDGQANSLLGMPVTVKSRTILRNYAQNRGAKWCQQLPIIYYTIAWLLYIEYATFNSQDQFTTSLTSEGFRTGGLGAGVTNVSGAEWGEFSGYKPFIKCGKTNSLGNSTGETNIIIPDFAGEGVDRSFYVNSYRGVENIFGHIYKWLDGVNILHQNLESGGKTIAYICNNISLLTDDTANNYKLVGELPRIDGLPQSIIGGVNGILLPTELGASTSSYFCDKYTSPASSGEYGWRALLHGGRGYYGTTAGILCSMTNYEASFSSSLFGTRLCYLP